jgi:hypothetical protein
MQKWILDILGQKAYEAFHQCLDNKVGKSCFAQSEYTELSAETREAWMAAAEEVIKKHYTIEDDSLALLEDAVGR